MTRTFAPRLKTMKSFQIIPFKFLALAGLSLSVILSGCNTAEVVDGVTPEMAKRPGRYVNAQGQEIATLEKNVAEDATGAKIIRESSSVTKKGTVIRALVNGDPVTNYDIKRRAAFLRLRRIGGNRTQKATNELIDERIKMDEASRTRSVASDETVNKAFADFAKRNRMSPSQMGRVLGQAGVSSGHFKEFLRAQISWQRTVGKKFQTETRGLSQSDALFSIRKSGGDKPETREYRLQQVIFVVPESKRKSQLKARRTQARTFAQGFTTCEETIVRAKGLRDVSVKNLGRVLEPELPPNWKDSVIATAQGKTTKTQDTNKGVEFIAVCALRNVSDDRAAQIVTQSKQFDEFDGKGSKVADEYLAELKSKATIVYR